MGQIIRPGPDCADSTIRAGSFWYERMLAAFSISDDLIES